MDGTENIAEKRRAELVTLAQFDDVLTEPSHSDLVGSRRRPRPESRVRSTAARDRDAFQRRALATADVIAAALALLLAKLVVSMEHPSYARWSTLPLILLSIPIIVVAGKTIGIYDRDELVIRKSTLDEAPVAFQLATLYALLVWLINGFVVPGSGTRSQLVLLWVGLFGALVVGRCAARAVSRRLTPPERCLVIGNSRIARRMQAKLEGRGTLHAKVVGHVPLSALEPNSAHGQLSADDLAALVDDLQIERIVLAPDQTDGDEVFEVVRLATALNIKISIVPRLLEVVGSSMEFDDIEGTTLLSVRRPRLGRSSRLVKRAMDVLGAVGVIVVFAPLMAVIATIIKLDSSGPVLFRQPRVGRDGRSFKILKFRTMVADAETRKNDLRHLNEATGLFKITDDPRITRSGRFLRRGSLDELPQLFNVLSGSMSLVGPRPLVPEEDLRIAGWQRRRLHLTPGMTGHWQILGSSRIPLEEMVKIDYLYVTNWSLWLDIKILLRTIPYILQRQGM